jgi:acyl-CoA synthetase (AMP-forming)/AMP-acid ligase II/thioesterase domain-containing protein/acyl carrier protein
MGNINVSKLNLLSLIECSCNLKGDRTAVFDSDDNQATFLDFKKSYDSVKSLLENMDIHGHMRVSIITKQALSYQLLAMPILDMAVLVPIDISLPEKEIAKILDLLSVDLLIVEEDIENDFSLIYGSPRGLAVFESFEKTGEADLHFNIKGMCSDGGVNPEIKNSEHVLINTTSGTTSIPKIVPVFKDQFIAGLTNRIKAYEYDENERILIVTKPYKSQSINAVVLSLYIWGCAVLMKTLKPNVFLETVERYGITSATAPPAFLFSLAEYIKDSGLRMDWKQLRFIRASGAPMPERTRSELENALGTRVIFSYGMTETKNITNTYREPLGHKQGSAGTLTGLELRSKNGEIQVRGNSVFKGYENKDIDNSEYFDDGWFRTGDLGYIDSDGYVFITGRIKEMINKGGEKVSPYEVEEAIMKHPGVSQTGVFPYPNNYGSENVGAVVVMDRSSTLNLKELRNFLEGHISVYKIPTLLYITDEIPVGSGGKVKRKELFKMLDKKYPKVMSEAGRELHGKKLTKIEKDLMGIWKKYLGRKKIDIHEKFLTAGGDSLNGAAILSEIEKTFGVAVPVNMLFKGGSLSSVSEYIDIHKSKASSAKFVVPINASGTKKPLFFIHSGLGDATTYRHIGAVIHGSRPVYALRYKDGRNLWEHPLSFKQIAGKYADEIMELFPSGPYHLCGHCWGGVLAHKIACEISARGGKVGMLAMLDSADKGKSREQVKASDKLSRRIGIAARDSLDQLGRYKGWEKAKVLLRKIKNISGLIVLNESKKFYGFGARHGWHFMMRVFNKAGALGFAYRNHKPELFNGRTYYIKSLYGKTEKTSNIEFWKNVSGEFEVIGMECNHNDIITGRNAVILADVLSEIMEKLDG